MKSGRARDAQALQHHRDSGPPRRASAHGPLHQGAADRANGDDASSLRAGDLRTLATHTEAVKVPGVTRKRPRIAFFRGLSGFGGPAITDITFTRLWDGRSYPRPKGGADETMTKDVRLSSTAARPHVAGPGPRLQAAGIICPRSFSVCCRSVRQCGE